MSGFTDVGPCATRRPGAFRGRVLDCFGFIIPWSPDHMHGTVGSTCFGVSSAAKKCFDLLDVATFDNMHGTCV